MSLFQIRKTQNTVSKETVRSCYTIDPRKIKINVKLRMKCFKATSVFIIVVCWTYSCKTHLFLSSVNLESNHQKCSQIIKNRTSITECIFQDRGWLKTNYIAIKQYFKCNKG